MFRVAGCFTGTAAHPRGLTAAIYTQTTDVEIKINGDLTYDRKVEKTDSEALRVAHEALPGNCPPLAEAGTRIQLEAS